MAIRVGDPVAFGGRNRRDDHRRSAALHGRVVDFHGERAAGILAWRRRSCRRAGDGGGDESRDHGAKRTDDGRHVLERSRRPAPMKAAGRRDALIVFYCVTANTQTTPPSGTSFCHPSRLDNSPCWNAGSTPQPEATPTY